MVLSEENIQLESVFSKGKENTYIMDNEQFIHFSFKNNAHEGFTLLFRRYHSVLCNHAVRFVWSKDIAQDIVSEVFYQFWKNKQFENINTSFRSYLFRAVRNGCYNYISRELKNSVSLDEVENSTFNIQTPDQIIEFDELQYKIENIITQLPPQCKKVFLMNRFDGKKYAEIASELNISQKTVEMHLTKANKALRAFLKDDFLLILVYLQLFNSLQLP
jgi:RNA polymerase sigma-70 factor (family 1)